MSIITLNVNTTVDENDGTNSGTGLSLRDAIIKANNDINNDYIIQLQGGEDYYLTIDAVSDDQTSIVGDLDINYGANVTITTVGNTLPTSIRGEALASKGVFEVVSGGTLSLENVTVSGGVRDNGGGIFNYGIISVSNSTFSNNSATNGGGIYNDYGIITVSNSTFSNNSATKGGCIFNNGTITVLNSTFSNNSATYYGGGIYNDNGTITVSNSTFSNNSATQHGGGILNNRTITVLNSTFSNNSATYYGGGIYANSGGGTTTISNTTITNNLAKQGGGIYKYAGSVSLKNTIVAGNQSSSTYDPNPDLSGSFVGNLYNLIGDMTGASGTVGTGSDIVLATGQTAGLGPLQNNGGATFTHALLTGSPAINAGNNVLISPDYTDIDNDGNKTEQAPYDQRGTGFVRISGTKVDIGAFEVQSTPLPTLAINDVTITEGNSGTTNATFTVTRTGTPTGAITVNYATANGTTNPATAGSDYTATTGTLTFATNETSKTITVPIIGDTTVESNETFFVNLSSATNATITDAQGLGTINDNDTAALPTLAINDVTITEGNSGTTNATFTVTRTGTATNPITVNYATADGTSNPATAGSDYTATTGTLTFATNETSKTITVPIIGDTTVESNETFFVNLSSATNATLADAQGLGTINDDDNTTSGILLIGDDDDNYLIGGSGNDTLQGLGGNDTLNGATGVDSLVGGLGNDIYYVENSGDIVVEASNGGTDIVNTNITYTLPANVENLAMIDSGNVNDNINGTGNTLNNKLTGNSGANTLIGDTGNDSLNGGKGNDTLNGGAGNDTYTVETLNDVITDSAGVDLVKSSVSWTLATGLENLTLIGSTAINGTGNSVNNIIIGNTGANTLTGLDGNDSLNGDAGNDTLLGGNGNDTLVGGVGNDSLTGGSGLDFFRFNAKTEGIDTITDFVVVDDTIQVAKSSFAGGLVVGTLLTTQFTLGASATTTAHRFGYESGTGKLWFDVDGSGATVSTQIATLPTGLALTNADIVVV